MIRLEIAAIGFSLWMLGLGAFGAVIYFTTLMSGGIDDE